MAQNDRYDYYNYNLNFMLVWMNYIAAMHFNLLSLELFIIALSSNGMRASPIYKSSQHIWPQSTYQYMVYISV